MKKMQNKRNKEFSKKRLCALLLTVVMVVTCAAVTAVADESVEPVECYELKLCRSGEKFEYYELSAEGIVREEKVETDSDGNITIFLYGETPGDVKVTVAVKSVPDEDAEADVWWVFHLRVHEDLRISEVFEEAEFDPADIMFFYPPELDDLVAASKVSVTINGVPISFISAPVIIEGRTLAPYGELFEALDIAADWEVSTLTGVKNDIKLTLHGYSMTRNDEYIDLDVPMQLVAGRTYVPVRAVAECFGITVDWDATTTTVLLTE